MVYLVCHSTRLNMLKLLTNGASHTSYTHTRLKSYAGGADTDQLSDSTSNSFPADRLF